MLYSWFKVNTTCMSSFCAGSMGKLIQYRHLLLFVVVLLVTSVCMAADCCDRMVVVFDCCDCTVVVMFHFYAHNSSIDCQQVYLDF